MLFMQRTLEHLTNYCTVLTRLSSLEVIRQIMFNKISSCLHSKTYLLFNNKNVIHSAHTGTSYKLLYCTDTTLPSLEVIRQIMFNKFSS